MNRKTQRIFNGCFTTATVLALLLSVTEVCAFQLSIKSRRSQPASNWSPQTPTLGRRMPADPWTYRQRPSLNVWNHNAWGGNRIHFSAGYYALPYYWGNHFSPLPQSQINASGYPSNITGYDAEFRRPAANQQRPTIAPSVSSSKTHSPATIANEHFRSPPEQIINSHFDLQQRLLDSNETPLIKSATPASNLQGHAEKAFRAGRYADAVYYCDNAVRADPHNGMIRLFCSQCHFAIGKYSVAILMLEQATMMLPESQWDYVAKHYDTFYGQDDYVAHTRALNDYLKRRPDDNRARTLLGYHYGCLGYKTTASKLFHQSLQTYRNDELAQRLIPIFGDESFSSTVVKDVQAPTPDLLEEQVIDRGISEQRLFEPSFSGSGMGNRVIYLTPEQTAVQPQVEELPLPKKNRSPEEIFFDQEESILMPALESAK